MGTYRVLKHYHDPDLGLGPIPKAICWVKGHNWATDNWIQRMVIDGETTIVNLPCQTCDRCLLSILSESQLDWLKTGFREQEAHNRRMEEVATHIANGVAHQKYVEELKALGYEEPPEGLEWMDGLEEEE